MLRPRPGWAADDPRVAGIVATTIGIDTHNHIDVPLTAAEMPGPDIDLAGEMKRSGLSAICITFATDYCIGTDTKLTQPGGRPGGGRGGGGRGPGQQNGRAGERTNQAWQDQTAGFYYVVVDAMLKTGFTPDEIGKIGGGNFLRIFGEAVKK